MQKQIEMKQKSGVKVKNDQELTAAFGIRQ